MRYATLWCVVLSMLLSVLTGLSMAAVDPVKFDNNSALDARYEQLTHVLRCPKCQNQSIGGSDAPIAQDMRRKVEQLLRDGLSDKEIEAFMIQRYGDYVTYNPPLKPRTFILWFGPLVFFLVTLFGFWFVLFRRPKKESV